MSTINKKPFIKSLVEDMTAGQIATLQQLVDGGGNQNALLRTMNIKPVGNRTHITVGDKGVHLCDLEANFSLYKGYLIFTEHYCVLIHFTDSQVLGMFDIDLNDLTHFATISEELSVLELRNELNDTKESEEADIIATVNEGIADGDIVVPTYKTFPSTWNTTGTTKAFCDNVAADLSAIEGMAYLGEVHFSDLPASLVNGELVVEVKTGDTASSKVITLTLTSGNVAPYHWEYTYWNNGTNVSGWVSLGTEVEANPTVPSGTTPTELAGIKIGSGYFDIPEGVQVVELNNSASGILTDEQYEKVMGDNCIIIWQQYSGATKYIFYKKSIRSYVVDYTAINFYSKFEGYYRTQIFRINISSKEYMLVRSNTNNVEEGTLPIVSANPTLSGSETALTGLQVGDTQYKVVGDEPDANVTVEIESDYTNDDYQNRTNYATAISLKDFIANCEAGNVYTNAGTIAKINNLIDGKAFRLILIGTNHDILAYDDTTVAKTTWQFLDMPEHLVSLGLPFNVIDWGSDTGKNAAMDYLLGINSGDLVWYPSNKGGYITASGLLNALHTIYEGLPIQLKRAIKTVRKEFMIRRQKRSINSNGGSEYDISTTGYIAQKLFHLSAIENNNTAYGAEGTAYAYLNSNARRIRYYNNTVLHYWLRTPSNTYSYRWIIVYYDGDISFHNTDGEYDHGVAPAFCI